MTIAPNVEVETVAAQNKTGQVSSRNFQPESRPAFGPTALVIATVGGLLTGTFMVAAASWLSQVPGAQDLQRIAASDIETAAQSLVAGQAAALVEEAKTCRRPLASLVVQATGKAIGTVRFRSGGYVSPNVQLSLQVERVALPFPAPLEAGHGQIFLDNKSDGADVFLLPGFRVGAGSSTSVIDVRWDPKGPCL